MALQQELKTWPTAYGPIVQRKVYANLLAEIIRTGKCTLCGNCIAVCPTNAVTYAEESPKLVGTCIRCGYCYYNCPATTDDTFKGFDLFDRSIYDALFEGGSMDVFGCYKEVFLAEAAEDALSTCEESIIKLIMKYGLKNGYFDAVGCVGCGEPATEYPPLKGRGTWEARALVVTKPEDLDKVRLKPLTPGLTLNSIRSAVEELKNSFFHGSDIIKVALFGPPQHIRAVVKMKLSWSGHRKLSNSIVLTATYFKRPFFSYAKLREELAKDGIELDEVSDWKIDLDEITFYYDGKAIKYTYESLKNAIHKGMAAVDDKIGEFSDVSVGRLKGMEGVLIVVRSNLAKEIISRMVSDGVLHVKSADRELVLNELRKLYRG